MPRKRETSEARQRILETADRLFYQEGVRAVGIDLGLTAVLGRLHATANFRAIAEELWPFIAGPPSTAMGEAEAAWLADRVP